MKKYSESELQELDEQIEKIIRECLLIDINNQVPNYEISQSRLRMAVRMIRRKFLKYPSPLLPTEEVVTKEDDASQKFLLHLVDVVWMTAKESEEVPSTIWAKKMIKQAEESFVPSDNKNEGTSVASHSCTIGNSIQQWISVDEELPEIGKYVLVSILNDTVLKGRLMSNGWAVFFADGECLALSRRVTHWMPLPKSPIELQGDAVSDTTEADSSNADHQIKIPSIDWEGLEKAMENRGYYERRSFNWLKTNISNYIK